MRDAIVAAIHLNMFNKHCDRVSMANIAQTVNVLQSVILTEGEKMILTPTYHVFNMFKVHQDAELLPLDMEYGEYCLDGQKIPQLSASASIDNENKIHISMCNLHPHKKADITCSVRGGTLSQVRGEILSASEMNSHNTFSNPCAVKPERFSGAELNNGELSILMPPMSIVVLTLE